MTTILTPVVLAACYGMGGGYKDYCADTGNPDGLPCEDTGVETDADGAPPDDGTGDSDDTGSSGDSDDTGSSGDSDDTGSSTEEDVSTAESKVPMDADFPECATGDDLAAR